jgi:hypothetical protein
LMRASPERHDSHGRARPDGERRAILHARSARAAPRHALRAEICRRARPATTPPRHSHVPPVPLPLLECSRGQARPSGYVCALHRDPREAAPVQGAPLEREFG